MIYLDHNATTPIDQRVFEAMLPYLQKFYGNPSSLYRFGRLVRSAIETAREQVASLVQVQPSQIIFTSGGTEANNLALNFVPENSHIAISAIEHPSLLEPAMKRFGHSVKQIPVEQHGCISQDSIENLITSPNALDLVSIMLANNETGAIQNIQSFSQRLKEKNILFHTDAVQALGKIKLNFNELNVDLMSLSGHKIYGPKGSGALVIKKNLAAKPLIIGGGQENEWRAGTENVPAIIGFGKAAELAANELNERQTHLKKLKDSLEQQLESIPQLTIFAESSARLPNTVQIGLPHIDGEMLLMQLDKNNIAVSSGSACSSGGGKASHVLTAMNIEPNLAKSAIRISLGLQNTPLEIDEFVTKLKSLLPVH